MNYKESSETHYCEKIGALDHQYIAQ